MEIEQVMEELKKMDVRLKKLDDNLAAVGLEVQELAALIKEALIF